MADVEWVLHLGGPVSGETLPIRPLEDGRLPPERLEADPEWPGVLHRYLLAEGRNAFVYVWEGH